MIFFFSADIEGSLSGFNNNKNISFSVFVRFENEGNIYYEILLCNNYSPTKIQKGYLFPCYLYLFKSPYIYWYDNIYLTPYTMPYKDSNPFQVIIDSD